MKYNGADIEICIDGHSPKNHQGGPVIVVENYDDRIQVLIWNNIGSEDPLVIGLDLAKDELADWEDE